LKERRGPLYKRNRKQRFKNMKTQLLPYKEKFKKQLNEYLMNNESVRPDGENQAQLVNGSDKRPRIWKVYEAFIKMHSLTILGFLRSSSLAFLLNRLSQDNLSMSGSKPFTGSLIYFQPYLEEMVFSRVWEKRRDHYSLAISFRAVKSGQRISSLWSSRLWVVRE